jgi:hypothetical protein
MMQGTDSKFSEGNGGANTPTPPKGPTGTTEPAETEVATTVTEGPTVVEGVNAVTDAVWALLAATALSSARRQKGRRAAEEGQRRRD